MKRLSIAVVLLALNACGDGNENTAPSTTAQSSPETGDFEQMWAIEERVQRRTCASEECGVVGQLFFRESAKVYEQKDGWARVTEPYSASCVGGVSDYVDRGRAVCTPENGIVDGQFAEWVKLDEISVQRPADPAETAALDEKIIAGSDDFSRHRVEFLKAATVLIADGRCTASDFEEMGGWLKSSNHRDEPIYFTYCGGMTISNRIYLDANSGRIFQD